VFHDETKPNSGNKFAGSSQVVFALNAAGFDFIPFHAKESLSSLPLRPPEPDYCPSHWVSSDGFKLS